MKEDSELMTRPEQETWGPPLQGVLEVNGFPGEGRGVMGSQGLLKTEM